MEVSLQLIHPTSYYFTDCHLSNLLQDVYFIQRWALISNIKGNNINFMSKTYEVLCALVLTAQLRPSEVLHTAVLQVVNIVVVFTAFDASLLTLHYILASFMDKQHKNHRRFNSTYLSKCSFAELNKQNFETRS